MIILQAEAQDSGSGLCIVYPVTVYDVQSAYTYHNSGIEILATDVDASASGYIPQET